MRYANTTIGFVTTPVPPVSVPPTGRAVDSWKWFLGKELSVATNRNDSARVAVLSTMLEELQ